LRGGTGSIEPVALPDLDPRSLIWTGQGHLLISAERKTVENGKEQTRIDWWLAADGQPAVNLTQKIKSAPADLVPERGGRTFVGVADGDLWRIDPAGGSATNLTSTFEPKIASIVWPGAGVPRAAGFERVIVGVQNEAVLDLHRVDLKVGEVLPFPRPSPAATLTAYRPDIDVAVFTANERNGTRLVLEHRGEPRALVATNGFLADIAEGALKQIEYRSLEGQDLKAWIIYPPGFKEGARYPVVAWVYAGSVVRETPSLLTRLNSSHPLNLQLLAARGYVVLLPSMPLAPEREPSDPYMELPKGVLPALDKLVDMGIADPKRLGVMGQSYGGYSTYGLITLTNRFKAAVSLAGLNDLVSLYGIFDMRSRYEPYAHERLFSQSIAESGQIRMGNPPWKDAGRYLRNSPLFYVDRVQTPLLIVQGDMDYVALQQGEQFFTALYRQGKRARFARYWGEGHVFSSPANIRDMWNQIYVWFDEFLATPKATSGTGQ
jgi:acetyl esterase/lipase